MITRNKYAFSLTHKINNPNSNSKKIRQSCNRLPEYGDLCLNGCYFLNSFFKQLFIHFFEINHAEKFYLILRRLLYNQTYYRSRTHYINSKNSLLKSSSSLNEQTNNQPTIQQSENDIKKKYITDIFIVHNTDRKHTSILLYV